MRGRKRRKKWRRNNSELMNSRNSLWKKLYTELIVELTHCNELFANF